MKAEVIERLWSIILDRRENPREGSYTNRMIGNPEELYGKILEEASEVVSAARESKTAGKDSLSWETADLIYHLMVLCASKKQDFNDVLVELESRMK